VSTRLIIGCVTAMAALGLLPAAAHAGTVMVTGGQLVHLPSQGQSSALVVTYDGRDDDDDEDSYLRISKTAPGPNLYAGHGCRHSDGSVRCERSRITSIRLVGGDGNDVLNNATMLPSVLDGRAGDDVLDGGYRNDVLIGGAGRDTASYGHRTASLTLDADGVADDGAPGEQDSIGTDVEDIVAGAGNDTLGGSPSANRLSGGAGADRLDGGAGLDSIDGGSGADTVVARENEADNVVCGSDSDSVAADPADSVAPDCEIVDVQGAVAQPIIPLPPPFAGAKISGKPITLTRDGRARVRIFCPGTRRSMCRGTVTIRDLSGKRASKSASVSKSKPGRAKKSAVLGRRKFRIRPGHSKRVSVKLSRNGRHRVRRRRRVRCSVNVNVRTNRKSVVTRRNVTLKAPKRGAKRRSGR
jgi:RTX calcium-binding nonapeptide repeat (4 copies)